MKVPVTATNIVGWVRDAANAINRAVKRDGVTIYTAPTISAGYVQAEVQALADAVEALSERLK